MEPIAPALPNLVSLPVERLTLAIMRLANQISGDIDDGYEAAIIVAKIDALKSYADQLREQVAR